MRPREVIPVNKRPPKPSVQAASGDFLCQEGCAASTSQQRKGRANRVRGKVGLGRGSVRESRRVGLRPAADIFPATLSPPTANAASANQVRKTRPKRASRLRARSGFGSGSPPGFHSLPNPFASRTARAAQLKSAQRRLAADGGRRIGCSARAAGWRIVCAGFPADSQRSQREPRQEDATKGSVAPGSAVKVSPKAACRRRRSASRPRGLPRHFGEEFVGDFRSVR